MDLQKEWTRFAADAEVDAYGTSRLCAAHNTLRAENARLLEENARLRGENARLLVNNAGLRSDNAEEIDRLRELLKRVLTCGLNEEPHGLAFTPSKQEQLAFALVRDIKDALRKEEE